MFGGSYFGGQYFGQGPMTIGVVIRVTGELLLVDVEVTRLVARPVTLTRLIAGKVEVSRALGFEVERGHEVR